MQDQYSRTQLLLGAEAMEKLQKDFNFEVWEKADEDHTIIRFVTSWATREEQVQELVQALKALKEN